MELLDLSKYEDVESGKRIKTIKSNGAKNPRANRKNKISDEAYFYKVVHRDNENLLYNEF